MCIRDRAGDGDNDTDKLAEVVMSMPGFVKKILVRTLKALDKYNMLPKSIIDASPFHTTMFFTYLRPVSYTHLDVYKRQAV